MVDNERLKIDWKKAKSLDLLDRARYFDDLAGEIAKASENADDCEIVPAGSQMCSISKKYIEVFLTCYEETAVSIALSKKIKGKTLEQKMNYLNSLAKKIASMPKNKAVRVSYGNKSCLVDEKYASLFALAYREFNKAREQLKIQNKPTVTIDYNKAASLNSRERADYFAGLLLEISKVPLRSDAELVTIDRLSQKVNKNDKDVFIECYKEFNKAKCEYEKGIEDKLREERQAAIQATIKEKVNNLKTNKGKMDYYRHILGYIINKANKKKCIERNIGSSSYNIDEVDEDLFDVALKGYQDAKELYTREISQCEWKNDKQFIKSSSVKDTINLIKEKWHHRTKGKKIFRGLVAAGVLSVTVGGGNIVKNMVTGGVKLANTAYDAEVLANKEPLNKVQSNSELYATTNTTSDISSNTLIKDIGDDSQDTLEEEVITKEINEEQENTQLVDDSNVSNEKIETIAYLGDELEIIDIDESNKLEQDSEILHYEEINRSSYYQGEFKSNILPSQEFETTFIPEELEFTETYEAISDRVKEIEELPEETILNEDKNADKGNEEICYGYHLTTGNTIYDMPLWEAKACMSVCEAEDNGTYQSAVAVFSGFANRFEDGRYTYATNFYDIISHEGQYSTWNQTKASNYSIDQAPDYLVKAFYDVFYVGIRNVDTVEFRAASNTADGRFQIVTGDNNHFKKALHVDRADGPSQVVTLSIGEWVRQK